MHSLLRGLPWLVLVCALLWGCTSPAAPTAAPSVAAPAPSAVSGQACAPAPAAVPTVPAFIPGYAELDPATNLHITGTYQLIDPEQYRLNVTGKVTRPLTLTLSELRCLPRREARLETVCPGYFVDAARWAGADLGAVLALAGVQPGAVGVRLQGADGYGADLMLPTALGQEAFLAYEWEGQAVPVLHGYPVRAVFPREEGNRWVKWLTEIDVY